MTPRWGVSLVVAVGLALGIVLTGWGPAYAHSALVSVTPADGSTVSTSPAHLVLVFNEDVNTQFVTVVLSSQGVQVATGTPVVTGPRVTTPVSDRLGAGDYRIAFRIVSVDGHPVSGESPFTVAGVPGTSTAPSTPSTAPTSSPMTGTAAGVAGDAPTGTPQGQKTGVLDSDHHVGLIAVAFFLVGGAALLIRDQRSRRRRATSADGADYRRGGDSGGGEGAGNRGEEGEPLEGEDDLGGRQPR